MKTKDAMISVLLEKFVRMEEWRRFSEYFFRFSGRRVWFEEAREEGEESVSGYGRGDNFLERAGVRVGGALLGEVVVEGGGAREEWGKEKREACRYFLERAVRGFEEELLQVWKEMKIGGGGVGKACHLIHREALAKELRLEEVARQCGMSGGHLSRLFHEETGMTFCGYVAKFRVEHARGLLRRGSKTVTEIAFESGFQSISQFHRVFRSVYGVSPREMRKGG